MTIDDDLAGWGAHLPPVIDPVLPDATAFVLARAREDADESVLSVVYAAREEAECGADSAHADGVLAGLLWALQLLAVRWADHPDFQDAWR